MVCVCVCVFVVCVNGVCLLRAPYVFTCDGGSATMRVYTLHQNFVVERHLESHMFHLRKMCYAIRIDSIMATKAILFLQISPFSRPCQGLYKFLSSVLLYELLEGSEGYWPGKLDLIGHITTAQVCF